MKAKCDFCGKEFQAKTKMLVEKKLNLHMIKSLSHPANEGKDTSTRNVEANQPIDLFIDDDNLATAMLVDGTIEAVETDGFPDKGSSDSRFPISPQNLAAAIDLLRACGGNVEWLNELAILADEHEKVELLTFPSRAKAEMANRAPKAKEESAATSNFMD